MNKRQIKKEYKKLCDKHNIPYSSFEVNRKNHTMKKIETRMVKRMLYNLREITKIRSFIFKHTMNTRYNFNKRQYNMESWLKEDLTSEDRGPRLEDSCFNYGSSCASDFLLHRADNKPTDIYDIDENTIYPTKMISVDLCNQSNITKLMCIKEESSNADECKTDLSV